jgi:ribosomal protein S12 methylthiotransferase accessory factor
MTSGLPEHPLIKRHLVTTIIGQDEVFVLAEDQAWLWKNRGLGFLLPNLDGNRTLSDLFELAESQLSPPEIIYLLNQLQELGLLAEGPACALDCSDSDLMFWHAMGIGEAEAIERVQQSRVRLQAISSHESAQLFGEALRTAGVMLVERGGTSLDLVVTDHYFRPELTQTNGAALASGVAWMVCKLIGQTLWIGPIFHPGRTGCMACLQHRLRLNRQVEDFVVRATGDVSYYMTSLGALSSLMRLGANWAAQEIALWLAGRKDRLEGKLLSIRFDRGGLDVATHILVRRPQCPICGSSDNGRRKFPLTLQRKPLIPLSNENFRIESAEMTLTRLNHHLSPITGVVTSLSDLAQDPEGLVNCYSAGHNFIMGPETPYWLGQSLRSRTGGKGVTATEARLSAVCEAIERYCGVFRDSTPRIRGTYDALRNGAVHPHRCLNFSSRQYDLREELNADTSQGFFHLIPRRFPEDLEIDWVSLWSLTHDEIRYLPAALCYYGHPDVGLHFYCTGDANGCAAGNVLEEAILHAFLELVERDSAAIWWYNRLVRPAVDLDSISDPYIIRLREWYERHGRQLWAIDITSDLRIPVIAAISKRIEGPTEDLLIGLGSHLDPTVALKHALTEVNQFLPAVSRSKPDGQTLYAWPDNVAVRFWKNETLSTQLQLVPDQSVPTRRLVDLPNLAGEDLYDNLQSCLRVAQDFHLDVMVLDQSQPDIDLNVVRVVVPGLRHFWRRLGPGRLYDVPVKLGWVAAPISERDMNPTSIFF